MQITARSRSKDPHQEALRQAKDAWNSEVSELIWQLIALKRGINGRGDRDAGLPPSTITNPLPPEVDQFLTGTSAKGSKIFEFAHRIIEQQDQYARGRQKIASWWGSRLYSRFDLWRKAEEKERELRKELLKTCVAIVKKLKRFEYSVLDYSNPLSVPLSFSALIDIVLNVAAVLLPRYLLLRDLLKALEKDSDQKSDVKDKNKSEPQDKNTPEPTSSEPTPPKELLLDDVKKQSIALGAIILFLKKKLTGDEAKKLEKLYDSFSKKLTAISLSKENENKYKEEIIKEYLTLIEIIQKAMGPSQAAPHSLSDYLSKVSSLNLEQSRQHWQTLIKQADFYLNKKINKKLLELSNKPINKLKLDLAQSSSDCRDYFDKLMNLLEKKESHLEEINNYWNPILRSLFSMSSTMEDLGRIYNENIRREVKQKNNYIREIKNADLSHLIKARERLIPYLFEVW